MKILIFDDSLEHCDIARRFLKDHDLTIVNSYDEAAQYLTHREVSKSRVVRCNPREFDVVMTDLMVPASEDGLSDEHKYLGGTQMPLGTIIALRAIACGIKRVAVVTDDNHHRNPASAAFDYFPPAVGDVKLMCVNDVWGYVDEQTFERVDRGYVDTEEGQKKYPRDQNTWIPRGLKTVGKDWLAVLNSLTS